MATAEKRTVTIPADQPFVRGRIGTRWEDFEDGAGQPSPLLPTEMGAPPRRLARPGRLNPDSIPYLYVATNLKTAVSEIRPWMEADVTIAYFRTLQPLRVIDTSGDKPKNRFSRLIMTYRNGEGSIAERAPESFTPEEKDAWVWGDINRDFSTPRSPNGTSLQYLGTQYLSEFFKANGFDGVAYQSSLSDDGHNLAIFDPEKARCSHCRMFDIKSIAYDYEESGNPVYLSDDGKTTYTRVTIVGPANAPSTADDRGQQ